MTTLKKLQTFVQQIHQDYQNLFNTVIENYLRIADQWTEEKFTVTASIHDICKYEQWPSFEASNFCISYTALLKNIAPPSITSTSATAFKLIASSFESPERSIPPYKRPNAIPFDLPQFIEGLNGCLNDHLRGLYTGPELGSENFPRIQFSYTGKDSQISLLYEKKSRNYHQETVNALVEAHPLLRDWWVRNNKPREWKSVTTAEQEVFKQSDFWKLLEAHPTLRSFDPESIFELYFSAFMFAEEGCTDVQLLVNTIRVFLKKATSSSSYSDFDDFSAYTGTNEKVLQLIKEKAEAEQAKIQNPYNKHIEEVYIETNGLIKPEDRATVLKKISAYSFTSINFGELYNEETAVPTAYNKAFNDSGSFNLRAYQQSINSILKEKLKRDMVYTGKNELILDYFHPKHPTDFHQATVNRLLEAHIKVKPWWGEYGPSSAGDNELISQFHKSEFCKIIEEHPILKALLPFGRINLYLSIFKDKTKGRYNIPAFIQGVKEALQKSPHFYQSYADFSQYTGANEAVNKAVQAAELAAVQKDYNKFLEETYIGAAVSYRTVEEKILWFEKFNHRIFLSIDPDKLNQLSMLDSYIASLGEEGIFDLPAFQASLNSVLEENLNFKMQYTGTDKQFLEALQVQVAKNAGETKPAEILAAPGSDEPEENTRVIQPIPADAPAPRAEPTNSGKTALQDTQIAGAEGLDSGNNAILEKILEDIIKNIQTGAGTRKTHSNSCAKIDQLTDLKKKITAHAPILANTRVQDEFLDEMEKICKIKRHFYHFWAEAHSVKELKAALELNHIWHSSNASAAQLTLSGGGE